MTISKELTFVCSSEEYSGVKKIAHKVASDVQKVFGFEPAFMECEALTESKLLEITTPVVIFGTFSKSVLIAQAEEHTLIQTREIFNKYECYNFTVKSNIIYICGSDKRGTIYGLFHLSELIGVSPLVDWNNLLPTHKDSFELEETEYLSNQPSVRYRGFFINDEWPAFGNWANHNFGGVNADCYEHIFELLLRLKGNYLWPAMWASRFSDDGPDLKNAELADELGVIMGASHHEPCCRAGEEYKYLRGKDSIYGDAWNFRTNQKGITRFWEDGLKRNGKFENVITVGMRGEADTAIMQNATLKDNIDLLRDVIKTQNALIKENVNEDLTKVPRMLALYKEVEPYFYGNKFTKGLMNDSVLDGITLMLCDDNHGNLRTVPNAKMRNHKGGYGMYYHFDYHGWPYSYEWINTSYLPKVKEQMCAAYNFGIRELWIVNVGDIITNEFPLSYFLDLAYDYEKYSNIEFTTQEYTKNWIDFNFDFLTSEQKTTAYNILDSYTKIANMRRTECLKPDTFSTFNFSEAAIILEKAEQIILDAEKLKKQTKNSPNFTSVFAQLVYPALGTMNVVRMNIFSGFNQFYAQKNLLLANSYVAKIKECLEYDKALIQENDTVCNGKFYAMGWSEHFGFNSWCEAMNSYPVYCTVEPTRKKRVGIWIEGSNIVTSGQDWAIRDLYTDELSNPNINQLTVNIATCSEDMPKYDFTFNKAEQLNWLSYKVEENKEKTLVKIHLTVNRDKLLIDLEKTAIMCIKSKDEPNFMVNIHINAKTPSLDYPNGTFVQTGHYISIEAPHFTKKGDCVCTKFSSPLLNDFNFTKKLSLLQRFQEDVNCHFEVLPGYGKTLGAVKAFPENQIYSKAKNAPYVEYNFVVQNADIYAFNFYLNPSNPAFTNNKLQFLTQVNGQSLVTNVVDSRSFAVGDNREPWGTDITNNIRVCTIFQYCKKGLNKLKFYPLSANIVLEKIVIHSSKIELPKSYLGAPETYRVIKE